MSSLFDVDRRADILEILPREYIASIACSLAIAAQVNIAGWHRFGLYVLKVAIMKVDSDVTSSARCWAQQQQLQHCDKHADRQAD